MTAPVEPNAIEFEVPVEGTDAKIAIARPDQGNRIVQLASSNPGLGLNIWEGPDGDDLEGFADRWMAWVNGNEELFPYIDVRFGNVAYLTRSAIPIMVAMSLQYHDRKDARAGVARVAVDPTSGLPVVRRS